MPTTQEAPAELELRLLLERYYRDTLGIAGWREAAGRRILNRPVRTIVARLNRFVPLHGKKVLDVGCGFGDLLLEARTLGADVFGVDPGREWIETGKTWLTSRRATAALAIGVGEALPFQDGSFHVVVSNQVLEHVQDPSRIISEMIRVLKPGGVCYISFPNYLLPVESHYRVPWIPFLPRRLGKAYLALLGRNPSYLDQIHYITPLRVSRILRRLGMTVEVDLTHEMIKDPSLVADRSYRTVARFLRFVHTPPFVVTLLSPNLSLIARKAE